MKRILTLGFFLLCYTKQFGQDLKGEWTGSFTYNLLESEDKIVFLFIEKNDSTYEAYSKTYYKDGKTVDSSMCILRGRFISKSVLELEEKEFIRKSPKGGGRNCFQIMRFQYYTTRKKSVLTGEWHTENNKCGYGQINLTKSKSEK